MTIYTSNTYVKNRDGDYITPSSISVYLNLPSGERIEETPSSLETGYYSFSYDYPDFDSSDGVYIVEWIIVEGTGQVVIEEEFVVSNMLDRWEEEREEREAELVRRRTSDDKVMGILNV